MKKIFVLILVGLFSLNFITAVSAAGTDVYFSEDVIIHLDDLNKDFTIKAGSQVELIAISGSSINATLATGSSLNIQSANRLDLNSSSGSTICPSDNTSASYINITAVGTVTISPTSNECVVHNAVVSGGGGGGGGGSTPTSAQTSQTTSDGTKINTDTSGDTMKAEIKPSADPTKDQVVSMDTASTAEVKQVKVGLTSDMIKELSAELTSGQSISVTIKSHEASIEQKTNEARAGMYMIGFDIFSVDILAGDKKISQLEKPIFLTFNITGIPQPENLKVYYYDETKKLWEPAGDGGKIVNGELAVSVDHLTNFTLMKEIAKTSSAEILNNKAMQWQNILGEAAVVFKSGDNLDEIINHNQNEKNIKAQSDGMTMYTDKIVKGFNSLKTSEKFAINNFIVYGTKSSQNLGKGERAGVVNSYKSAFGKLPITEAEWKDCIAIGNGRWPNEKNIAAENKSLIEFKKIYKREPNRNNAHDDAAVTVISYGLRPTNRNLNSEKAAIKSFKAIYKYAPLSATDWDIVRAIAYSGATR